MDCMDLPRPGRSWVALLAGALVAVWASLLAVPVVGVAQSCLCGTAADDLVAERAGLVREWIVQLPFDSAGWQVEHVTVGDGLVVAVSGDGGVHAVSTAVSPQPGATGPGVLAWSQRIGKPSGPVLPAGIGPGVVAVARDLDLYALERTTGQVRWHEQLGRLPGAAPAVIGDWVYAPLMNDGVLRTPANPLRPAAPPVAAPAPGAPHKPAAKGRGKKPVERKLPVEKLAPSTIDAGGRVDRAPQAISDAISWLTREGTLIVLAPNENGWERLEFPLNAAPVGATVPRGDAVFVTTRAGELARIVLERSPQRLRAEWSTLLDAVPDSGPLLSDETLVVSLGEHGLVAYDAADGRLLWRTNIAGTPLAIVGKRIWILDRVGRLSAVDLATGVRRERLCLGCFTLPVINPNTPRLVLASPGGLLVSLATAVPPAPPAKKPAAPPQPADEQPAADAVPASGDAPVSGDAPAADPTAEDAADGPPAEAN